MVGTAVHNCKVRVLGVLVCAVLLWSGVATGSEQVERWGVFELKLDGPKDANPFVDVEFTAEFTNGDRSVGVTGFYDGEGVYRVRFIPDKLACGNASHGG